MSGYTIFLVVCNLLIPVVMLCGGVFMLRGGRKKINSICGYRSRSSMRTMETWRFAHRYCGRLWLIFGGVTLGVSIGIIVGALLGGGEQALSLWTLLCMAVQVVAVVYPIRPTERALSKNFDKYGCPVTEYGKAMSGEQWNRKTQTKE